MTAEAAKVIIDRRGIQEHGKAIGDVRIKPGSPCMENVQVILECDGVRAEGAGVNDVGDNTTPLLLRRKAPYHGIEPTRVEPFRGLLPY